MQQGKHSLAPELLQRLAALEPVDARGLVVRGGQQLGAVPRERHRRHSLWVRLRQLAHADTGGHLPHLDASRKVASGEVVAVPGESAARHSAVLHHELSLLLVRQIHAQPTGFHVPYLDVPIGAAGDGHLAVGRHRRAVDLGGLALQRYGPRCCFSNAIFRVFFNQLLAAVKQVKPGRQSLVGQQGLGLLVFD